MTMRKQTRQQQQTQGISSKDNDNNQQIQTQDKKLLSSIVGLRPAHQPLAKQYVAFHSSKERILLKLKNN